MAKSSDSLIVSVTSLDCIVSLKSPSFQLSAVNWILLGVFANVENPGFSFGFGEPGRSNAEGTH